MTATNGAARVSRRSLIGAGLGFAAWLGLERTGLASASALEPTRGLEVALSARPAASFAWSARHNLTAADYQAEFDKHVKQGYRLLRVSGYEVGGQVRYAAIWDKSPGPAFVARHGLNNSQYQAEFDRLVGQGYRLVHLNGYNVGGQAQFAAIWEKTGGPDWVGRHGLTAAQYQTEFDKLLGQGYRPIQVSGYAVGGQPMYAAIFEKRKGPDFVARHGLTAAQYQTEFDKLVGQGFRLAHVSGYTVGDADQYAAIWLKGAGPRWVARHGLNADAYQAAFNEHTGKGFRPVSVDGYGAGGSKFAAIWESQTLVDGDFAAVDAVVKRYMTDGSIPGISLAIVRRGALVFAKAYGVANSENNEKLTEKHVLRIASLSKPITSVAIMKLVEAGKLTLGQTVFGAKGILGAKYGKQPYGTNIESITVQHLLQHTAGGWSNDNTDPMFTNPTMDHEKLISWTLDNRPLQNAPGAKYAYSNFGYCVLGRVIEKVTGQSYADYVTQNVLKPAGIANMHLGGDTKAERRGDEATYYGAEDPYGMKVRRMDSHGGWIASPTDVARFAVRADGFATVPDLLKSETTATMTKGSTANPKYASGWAVNELNNWWHTGRLPGTAGILVRANTEFDWVALSNRDGVDLDQMMWDVYNVVASWPAQDLF